MTRRADTHEMPLFADEAAIARLLLGPKRVSMWKAMAPLLEAKGIVRARQSRLPGLRADLPAVRRDGEGVMGQNTFAARLRAARERRDMTAAHLASLTGIAAANISHYEAGQMKPGVDYLRALALMLDISADYLLGLSDSTARIKRAEP